MLPLAVPLQLPAHLPVARVPDAVLRPNAPLPLPPPPTPRPTPANAPMTANDRHGVEGAWADSNKLNALRDYRRAHELCFKCGERCGHDHMCPT